MDPTDKYINMCEKAWPYLKTIFDYKDIVYSPSRQALCKTSYRQDANGYLKPVFVKFDDIEMIQADDFFIVWQERQLQDMIAESNVTYSQYLNLRRSSNVLDNIPRDIDGSYLQSALLLALVIHERYGKTWNGEDWIAIEGV
jgi:hypothetical protein